MNLRTDKNSKPTERAPERENCLKITLSPVEGAVSGAVGYAGVLLILWLFYRILVVVLFAGLGAFLGVKAGTVLKRDKVKQQIKERFSDVLGALSSSIEAGETPEHALESGVRSLSGMYSPKDPVLKEAVGMIRKIRMNGSMEEAFTEFARKMDDEDISRFAEVFALTKRRGGDVLSVIRASQKTICEKAGVKREIRTTITAKRLEAMITTVMPPGILLYFSLTDRTFLSPLYSGAGRVLMTVLLLVYAGCIMLALKITRIEV